MSELAGAAVRIARPSTRLDEARRFYLEGLGLPLLGGFEDHEGFDGFMAGYPARGVHFEITHERGVETLPPPSHESLFVFYVLDEAARDAIDARLRGLGFPAVPASNPYWDRFGRTYADPDGFRVVVARPPR